MTAAQFAKIARVSKGTVLLWIRKGELPATRVLTERGPGYEIEMDEAQALEWLKVSGRCRPFPRMGRRPGPSLADLVFEDKMTFSLACSAYIQGLDLESIANGEDSATTELDLQIRANSAITAAQVFVATYRVRIDEDREEK